MKNAPSIALITPSYAPDVERCRRLCASVKLFVDPSIPHVLVVPKRDRNLFEPMANDRTRVVSAESVLPPGTWQLPFQHRWWVSSCSLLVRGWIIQQVIKLSAPNLVDTESVVCLDSDIVFIRPFGPSHIIQGGQVRLYRVPGGGNVPSHHRYHRRAGKLLGIEPLDYYGSNYSGPLVSWRCDTLRQLQERIERIHDRPWQYVLLNTLHFSEYIMYGIFVEHVLSGTRDHYFDQESLCHCSYHFTQKGRCDLNDFLQKIRPQHIAVLVQSNLGIDPAEYEKKIKELHTTGIKPPIS